MQNKYWIHPLRWLLCIVVLLSSHTVIQAALTDAELDALGLKNNTLIRLKLDDGNYVGSVSADSTTITTGHMGKNNADPFNNNMNVLILDRPGNNIIRLRAAPMNHAYIQYTTLYNNSGWLQFLSYNPTADSQLSLVPTGETNKYYIQLVTQPTRFFYIDPTYKNNLYPSSTNKTAFSIEIVNRGPSDDASRGATLTYDTPIRISPAFAPARAAWVQNDSSLLKPASTAITPNDHREMLFSDTASEPRATGLAGVFFIRAKNTDGTYKTGSVNYNDNIEIWAGYGEPGYAFTSPIPNGARLTVVKNTGWALSSLWTENLWQTKQTAGDASYLSYRRYYETVLINTTFDVAANKLSTYDTYAGTAPYPYIFTIRNSYGLTGPVKANDIVTLYSTYAEAAIWTDQNHYKYGGTHWLSFFNDPNILLSSIKIDRSPIYNGYLFKPTTVTTDQLPAYLQQTVVAPTPVTGSSTPALTALTPDQLTAAGIVQNALIRLKCPDGKYLNTLGVTTATIPYYLGIGTNSNDPYATESLLAISRNAAENIVKFTSPIEWPVTSEIFYKNFKADATRMFLTTPPTTTPTIYADNEKFELISAGQANQYYIRRIAIAAQSLSAAYLYLNASNILTLSTMDKTPFTIEFCNKGPLTESERGTVINYDTPIQISPAYAKDRFLWGVNHSFMSQDINAPATRHREILCDTPVRDARAATPAAIAYIRAKKADGTYKTGPINYNDDIEIWMFNTELGYQWKEAGSTDPKAIPQGGKFRVVRGSGWNGTITSPLSSSTSWKGTYNEPLLINSDLDAQAITAYLYPSAGNYSDSSAAPFPYIFKLKNAYGLTGPVREKDVLQIYSTYLNLDIWTYQDHYRHRNGPPRNLYWMLLLNDGFPINATTFSRAAIFNGFCITNKSIPTDQIPTPIKNATVVSQPPATTPALTVTGLTDTQLTSLGLVTGARVRIAGCTGVETRQGTNVFGFAQRVASTRVFNLIDNPQNIQATIGMTNLSPILIVERNPQNTAQIGLKYKTGGGGYERDSTTGFEYLQNPTCGATAKYYDVVAQSTTTGSGTCTIALFDRTTNTYLTPYQQTPQGALPQAQASVTASATATYYTCDVMTAARDTASRGAQLNYNNTCYQVSVAGTPLKAWFHPNNYAPSPYGELSTTINPYNPSNAYTKLLFVGPYTFLNGTLFAGQADLRPEGYASYMCILNATNPKTASTGVIKYGDCISIMGLYGMYNSSTNPAAVTSYSEWYPWSCLADSAKSVMGPVINVSSSTISTLSFAPAQSFYVVSAIDPSTNQALYAKSTPVCANDKIRLVPAVNVGTSDSYPYAGSVSLRVSHNAAEPAYAGLYYNSDTTAATNYWDLFSFKPVAVPTTPNPYGITLVANPAWTSSQTAIVSVPSPAVQPATVTPVAQPTTVVTPTPAPTTSGGGAVVGMASPTVPTTTIPIPPVAPVPTVDPIVLAFQNALTDLTNATDFTNCINRISGLIATYGSETTLQAALQAAATPLMTKLGNLVSDSASPTRTVDQLDAFITQLTNLGSVVFIDATQKAQCNTYKTTVITNKTAAIDAATKTAAAAANATAFQNDVAALTASTTFDDAMTKLNNLITNTNYNANTALQAYTTPLMTKLASLVTDSAAATRTIEQLDTFIARLTNLGTVAFLDPTQKTSCTAHVASVTVIKTARTSSAPAVVNIPQQSVGGPGTIFEVTEYVRFKDDLAALSRITEFDACIVKINEFVTTWGTYTTSKPENLTPLMTKLASLVNQSATGKTITQLNNLIDALSKLATAPLLDATQKAACTAHVATVTATKNALTAAPTTATPTAEELLKANFIKDIQAIPAPTTTNYQQTTTALKALLTNTTYRNNATLSGNASLLSTLFSSLVILAQDQQMTADMITTNIKPVFEEAVKTDIAYLSDLRTTLQSQLTQLTNIILSRTTSATPVATTVAAPVETTTVTTPATPTTTAPTTSSTPAVTTYAPLATTSVSSSTTRAMPLLTISGQAQMATVQAGTTVQADTDVQAAPSTPTPKATTTTTKKTTVTKKATATAAQTTAAAATAATATATRTKLTTLAKKAVAKKTAVTKTTSATKTAAKVQKKAIKKASTAA